MALKKQTTQIIEPIKNANADKVIEYIEKNSDEELQPVFSRIPKKLHKKLKLKCIEKDISMQDIVQILVEEWVNQK